MNDLRRIAREDLRLVREGEPLGLRAPAPGDYCPICRGVGYLTARSKVGAGFDLVPCLCTVQERAQRLQAQLLAMSNLGDLADKTFATFDAARPGLQRAVDCARQYAADLVGGRPRRWLILAGGVGVGKTHLAAAIAWAALEARVPTIFCVVADLLDHLRATFAPDSAVRFDERFNQVRESALLVLDDLGVEAATPWAREKLYQLVNTRYNKRLSTVITTNQDLGGLEERLASRLLDRSLTTVVTIKAADYRRQRRMP